MDTLKRDDKKEQIIWLSNEQIKVLSVDLRRVKNKQHFLAFSLLLNTGRKFSKLAKIRWRSINLRLGLIYLNDRVVKLTKETIEVLEELRETATNEHEKIFSVKFEKFWHKFARICADQKMPQMGAKVLKHTFARRHYQIYQDKKKLAHAMGLSTVRYLPKQIFENINPIPLFQIGGL